MPLLCASLRRVDSSAGTKENCRERARHTRRDYAGSAAEVGPLLLRSFDALYEAAASAQDPLAQSRRESRR